MGVNNFSYNHFDEFIESFLIEMKPYANICKNPNLTAADFDNAFEYYCDYRKGIKDGYEIIDKEGKTSKEEKEIRKDEVKSKANAEFNKKLEEDNKLKAIFIHAIWLWAYPVNVNFISALKQYGITSTYTNQSKKDHVAGIGTATSQKPEHIKFILLWFKEVVKGRFKDRKAVKDAFVKQYANYNEGEYKNNFARHIILHLCEPDNYEPIGIQNEKEWIASKFASLAGSSEKNDDDTKQEEAPKGVDEKIQKIRKELNRFVPGFSKKSFYSNGFSRFWKENKDVDDDIKKLQYKKAMMLYGPPGTGKTYEAMELAQTLIGHEFADAFLTTDNRKGTIIKEFFGKNIFHLQFHVNYTYDDFVAGMVIENGNTQVRKGFIYDVIERANKLNEIHDGLPVVVILDETNRTDISRVFGELFSAIEKRGEDIDLSLKIPSKDDSGNIKKDDNDMIVYEPMKINIPDNVYFIGTMNEIDFSLERIDFALRRRFIWILKTFDEAALKKILENKVDDNFEINKYISLCKKVNDKVKEKLGKEYLIGHSFFAEIANIMDEMDLNYDEARLMLWNISILPTLEAYCGSMDVEEKKKFIIDCANAFALEYKDEQFVPKLPTSALNTNQPTTDTSVNGKNEEFSTGSADE